jgi:hypothetical protein
MHPPSRFEPTDALLPPDFWPALKSKIIAGDVVVLEWGHNDVRSLLQLLLHDASTFFPEQMLINFSLPLAL